MRTRRCEFYSDGIRLEGLLQLPEDASHDGHRGVIVLCSGFQGLKELIEIPEGHHLDWIEPGHPLYLATIPRILRWFQQHLPI